MADRDCTPSTSDPKTNPSDTDTDTLTDTTTDNQLALTELCDSLDECMALHYFFYEAMEAMYERSGEGVGIHHAKCHLGLLALLRQMRRQWQSLGEQVRACRSSTG